MTITRIHSLPKHHLTAPEFDRALVFTRTQDRTQQIARALLVDHFLPGLVASRFTTTKQNVYRAAQQLLKDAAIAQNVFSALAREWNQLAVSPDVAMRALPFVMQEITLVAAAQEAECSIDDVLNACKEITKVYQANHIDNEFSTKVSQFLEIMRFSRARDKAFQVSYDGFVMGLSLTELAEKHGLTRQNAYNIMRRFSQTQERFKDSS